MESDDVENPGVNVSNEERDSSTALNSLILEYYKKFGRKRDLEQYFSLSTAQSEIRDPTSSFWRKMKAQNSSSDSGGKKSESSNEVCRISIKCSVLEPSNSQEDNPKTKSDSDSPPIITDDAVPGPSRHSDDEASVKSDDYHSQKSMDVTLDTSINKIVSPSSSITSQRKLEWDSLADVGYANESDRKASSSSLSTLERLALKQQISNNDTKGNIGTPTAHSTMLDVNESKSKSKKGFVKKTAKISSKNNDSLQVSLPKCEKITPQSLKVNLTKHISFNVEKDGGISISSVKQDVDVSPEKSSATNEKQEDKYDKEIQTSMIKPAESYDPRIPVLINLNTLRKRCRTKKLRTKRRKLRVKKKLNADKENVIPVLERSGEQVSEAESFEYMPGHMYHQNQMKHSQHRSTTAGNKSSLESSGAANTTDSSKNSKYSFTKDLEKSIDLLKNALNKKYKDSNLKKELIKGVVQRLLDTRYRDDNSSTEFLSGLSYSSRKLGLRDGTHTTTSTSDTPIENVKPPKPKKSILRLDKFNSNPIASTSQSVPNLTAMSNSEKLVSSKPDKPMSSFNTESDLSSKEKHSSDTAFAKTSSEELYQKYITALKREQAYKKHLKEKEQFLKQKLIGADRVFKIPIQLKAKSKDRLKDLMKDLTRNNYDDGSGDASKLEGGSNSYTDANKYNFSKHRNPSVFTLSSCQCGDNQNRKGSGKISESEQQLVHQVGTSKKQNIIYGCSCRQSTFNVDVADSSTQCNIKKQTDKEPSHTSIAHVVSDDETGDVKYVCVCAKKGAVDMPENIRIYKCSRLTNAEVQTKDAEHKPQSICSCFGNKHSPRSKPPTQYSESNEESYQKLQEICACFDTKTSQRRKPQTQTSTSKEDSGQKSHTICACFDNKQSPRNKPLTQPSTLKDDNAQKSQEICACFDSKQSPRSTQLIRPGTSKEIGIIQSVNSKSSQTNVLNALKLSHISSGEASPLLYKNISQDNKNIMVYDSVGLATRIIQTEISMNPRIPEATMSDINIIDDEDLVKFVSASYKEIPKKKSEDNPIISQPDTHNYIHSVASIQNLSPFLEEFQIGVDVNPVTTKTDKEIQSELDGSSRETEIQDENGQEKFTIPIKGTNMTLLVSLGSNASTIPPSTNKTELVNQGQKPSTFPLYEGKPTTLSTATYIKKSIDKVPSSVAESKGVQSQSSAIFEDFDRRSRSSSKGVQSQKSDLFDNFDRQSKEQIKYDDLKQKAGTFYIPPLENKNDTYEKKIYSKYSHQFVNEDREEEPRSDLELLSQKRDFVPQSIKDQFVNEDVEKELRGELLLLSERRHYAQQLHNEDEIYMSKDKYKSHNISNDNNKKIQDQLSRNSNNDIEPPADFIKMDRCYKEQQPPQNQYKHNDDTVEESQSGVYYDNDNKKIKYIIPSKYQREEKLKKKSNEQSLKYTDAKNKPNAPSFGLEQVPQHSETTNNDKIKQINDDDGSEDSNNWIPQMLTKNSQNKDTRDSAQQSDEDLYSQQYIGKATPIINIESQPRYKERKNKKENMNDELIIPKLGSGFRNTYPRNEPVNEKRPLMRSSTDLSLQTDLLQNNEHAFYQSKPIESDKTSKDTLNYARQTEVSEPIQKRTFTYNNETLQTFLHTGTDSESQNTYDFRKNRVSSKEIQTSIDKSPDIQNKKTNIDYEEISKKSTYGDTNEIQQQYYDNRKHRRRSPTHTESPESPRPTRHRGNSVTKSKWDTHPEKYKKSISEDTSKAGTSEKCKEKKNNLENKIAQKRPRSPYYLQRGEAHKNCASMPKCTTHKTCKCKCSCKESTNSDSSNDCSSEMQGTCTNAFLTNTFHGVNCPCMSPRKGPQTFESSNVCWSGMPPHMIPGFKNPCCSGNHASGCSSDPIMNLIQDITNRYSKKDVDKDKRKRCFKEIMCVLSYLLDTEDSTCPEECSCCVQSSSEENVKCSGPKNNECPKDPKNNQCPEDPKNNECDQINSKSVNRGVQLPCGRVKRCCQPDCMTCVAGGSSEAPTCQILNNIKRECEKYYRKHCSTNFKCSCKPVTQCHCRKHKCKCGKSKTNVTTKKKNQAYNLIVKQSETLNTTETNNNRDRRPLQNVVVKVPPKRKQSDKVPFKEMSAKIERNNRLGPEHYSNPRILKGGRSRSWPNECEVSSGDQARRCPTYTVRQYLEKNRPDFVQNCSQRQDCLKVTNEKRPEDNCAPRLKMVVVHPPNYNGCTNPVNMRCPGTPITNCKPCVDAMTCNPCFDNHNVQYPCPVTKVATERSAHRKLLSAQLARQNELRSLSESQLRQLASQLGISTKSNTQPPKFISEREMKKHSQKIYKSLPEVTRKKEEIRKENMKKTNLLMASLFKKNLQKKILRGSVNLSNYSTVIKI